MGFRSPFHSSRFERTRKSASLKSWTLRVWNSSTPQYLSVSARRTSWIRRLAKLSILLKSIGSYDEFAKSVSASFGDESSKIKAIRKAKGMFAKAIESDDSGAVAYGHLSLARIAKLQGGEETSKEHYAKVAELGVEENDSSSSSMFKRIFDSMPFFNLKR